MAHNLKLLFLKIMMVQLDSFQKIFGFHPFSCHCGSLSLQKSLFVNNLWHEVMSTKESRWILGIDQTLVFKNCLLSSTKHLYIFEHLWPYEAQISGIVGASDSQTICIFANLKEYSGPESSVYLQISCIFANLIYSGPKGAQISWIFLNLLDILVSPGNLESPGYWGSMKCKSTEYS